MKKGIAISAISMAMMAGLAMADVTVTLPKGDNRTTINVEKGYIKAIATQKRGEAVSMQESVPVKDGKAVIATMLDGAAQYVIPFGERQFAMVYTNPGDDITVTVDSISPLIYSAGGSVLMDGITSMNDKAKDVLNQYASERGSAKPDAERLDSLETAYYAVFTDYVNKHPDSPASVYAVMQLDGHNFIDYYEALSPAARQTALMPFADAQKVYVERTLEMERRKAKLMSGKEMAPDFTFKDSNGKDVSLKDYRGKWVIIDFWGSWCRWCIKGFPSLKEAYAKYRPELEVIGVACNDSREVWENALKKYELPWVNLYNPSEGGGPVLQDYAVEGFPTKVIVDPEGRIRNITSGDNPGFYDVLKQLMGK